MDKGEKEDAFIIHKPKQREKKKKEERKSIPFSLSLLSIQCLRANVMKQQSHPSQGSSIQTAILD